MKRIIAIMLAALLCLSTTVFAENALEDNSWKTGLAASLEEKNENGETFYRASGYTASYQSPWIDIFPTIEKMIGDEDEVTVKISFEYRGSYVSEPEANDQAKVLIRAGGISDLAKNTAAEDFANIYEGSIFKKVDATNILSDEFSSQLWEITDEWQTVEEECTVFKEDIGENLFTEWNLCFSGMTAPTNLKYLDLKNFTITSEDDTTVEKESPAPTEKTEPTAIPTETPTATLAPTATEAPAEATATPAQTKQNNNTGLIIGIIAGAAAIAAGAAALIIIKKKKRG